MWLLRLKMLKKLFCPNLFLHSFWAEKQSQLSCSFVLIARKEFLCFNYKKIWGKNFFCPVGALSIAITQAQCFNWAVYSAWSRYPSFHSDTETELSTILKTALRRKLVYPNCHLQQILLQIFYVLLLNRASGYTASDGFISFPLFWNERCHASHLVQTCTLLFISKNAREKILYSALIKVLNNR